MSVQALLGGVGDIHDLPLGFRTQFFGCPEFAEFVLG